MPARPRVAIVDANTLAAMGLRQILEDVMPFIEVEVLGSFKELVANHPEELIHYFVETSIVLSHMGFFKERRHKTIVLTTSTDPESQLSQFHSLCINVPEKQLVKSILYLEQYAHAEGKNLPPIPKDTSNKVLSDREIEVMTLIVKGLLNKEIADKLNIGLTTVITHRKNIMKKLNMKSVSSLTIYAVMHGYVDINKI